MGSANLVGSSSLFRPSGLVRSGPNSLAGTFAGELATDDAIQTAQAFGIALAVRTGTANSQSGLLGRQSNWSEFGFHATHADGAYAGAFYVGAGYSIVGKPTGGALANNTRYVLGVSFGNGSGAVYHNGVKTGEASSLGVIGASGNALCVGQNTSGGEAWSANPSFEYVYVWNYVPTDDIFAAVARNPWQLFAPIERRIWVPVSAGSGTQTLTPDLFTNNNTFYTHTVTTGAVTLTPDLVTNTNSFYTPTVSSSYTVTPDLFTNTNTFYTPVVTNLSTLYPDLFTNSQTFYTHVVTGGGGQTLEPELFSNSATFYGPTITVGSVTLTASLFTNTNDIYTHTVTSNYP